jgi:hypothetical protein
MPTEDTRTEDLEVLPDEVAVWTAHCPSCEELHLTMLTRATGEGGPWTEIVGGTTEVPEEDFYCTECRSFVNLKDAEVWQKAERPD